LETNPTSRSALLVQIVLFDGVDPLDVIAPFEVFSAGSDALAGALNVRLVGATETGFVTTGTCSTLRHLAS
jgi:hypothetical protein